MKSEVSNTDMKENKIPTVEKFRSIQPEHKMSPKELLSAVKNEFDKVTGYHEKNLAPEHKDCMTTSEERKERAGYSKGEWNGEPGNSVFVPEKPEARDALSKYNQSGIEYRDGEPDFSKVSEATVKIEGMTSSRPANFRKADEECAKQWNEQKRDGKTDWTIKDVTKWRQENKYSWHEQLDTKTMNLVERTIHEECKHCGGISECKRHEALNGSDSD
ncbi:MAG: HNH endonuclease [Oscillospiraceae bacterium]|nr:HNH endonuclease [Oscillospiraceae bacterium]